MTRLVVLNSCAGAASGPTDVFSGTAAALVRGGVSAVAAMQYEISDPAAVAFCRGFYGAIARGRGVDEAVSSGRVAILGLSGRTLEWVTPVLYLRGRDSRLFTVPKPSWADTAPLGNRGVGQGRMLATAPPGSVRADGRRTKPRYTNCVVCGWPFSQPGGQTRPNCQAPSACAKRVNSGWLPGIGDPRNPHNLGAVTADEAKANQAAALANGMLPPEYVASL